MTKTALLSEDLHIIIFAQFLVHCMNSLDTTSLTKQCEHVSLVTVFELFQSIFLRKTG